MDRNQPPHFADLSIALDACRPGSDDLERLFPPETAAAVRCDPELARRHDQLQEFDGAVRRAFAQVEAPVGLSERLLKALAAESSTTADTDVPGQVELPESRREHAAPAGMSRRRWIQMFGGAAATTAAGLAYVWFSRREEPAKLNADRISEEIAKFHWNMPGELPLRDELTDSPPEQFPLSSRFSARFKRPGLRRWRVFDGELLGRSGVAYELLPAGQPRAVLYVLNFDGPRGAPVFDALPDHPGTRGIEVSGQINGVYRRVEVTSWREVRREGTLLYASVVEIDEGNPPPQFFERPPLQA